MHIHRVDLADQSSLLDIYATNALQSILPKYRMPNGRTEPRAAYALTSRSSCPDDPARRPHETGARVLSFRNMRKQR